MYNIVLISSSVRTGRASHRVALFFKKFIEDAKLASVDMVDLLEYRFPIFEERLSKMKEPTPKMLQFSEKVKGADGVIIVTPEYNGGYPAALKNVVDLLYPEWKRKPIALASVSDGQYAGSQVLTSLSFSLHKIGATVVPSMYRVANVLDVYDENGNTTDIKIPKIARSFVDDLIWYMEAKKRMETN